jgi:molybdopterin-guanine dinucleotide biosynthesis protein A
MADQRAIVAVLAGGRGDRLGGGKPSVAFAGSPLICHPLRAAAGAGLEAIVLAKRSTPLPALRSRVLYEPDEPRHPLRGLVTALSFAAALPHAPAVIALACDMPFVTGPLLAWLAALDGAVVASIAGSTQPLLGRYPVDALPLLERALLDVASLRSALAALAPAIVDESELSRFGDPARLCFNVNDPRDLRVASRWLADG